MSFKSKRIYTMSLCQFISLLLLQRPVATWLRNYPTSEVEAVCFCALPLSMRPCTLYIAIYHMHTVWPCIWRNGLAPCCAMTVGKSTSGIKYQNFLWQIGNPDFLMLAYATLKRCCANIIMYVNKDLTGLFKSLTMMLLQIFVWIVNLSHLSDFFLFAVIRYFFCYAMPQISRLSGSFRVHVSTCTSYCIAFAENAHSRFELYSHKLSLRNRDCQFAIPNSGILYRM